MKYILTLFIIIQSLYMKAQPHNCDCEKSHTGTQVTLLKENGNLQITSHCVSYYRLYLIDKKGLEYEKFELDCIAEHPTTYQLAQNVVYKFHNKKGFFLPDNEAKEKFITTINSKAPYYFKYQFNKEGEITQIFDFSQGGLIP